MSRWQSDPILTVEHLTMRFGGLVAVDDLSFDGRPRRHHRADRPERRRQDHGVQLHHRLLQADRGPIALRRSPPSRTARGLRRLERSSLERMPTSRSPTARASPAPSRTSACSAA